MLLVISDREIVSMQLKISLFPNATPGGYSMRAQPRTLLQLLLWMSRVHCRLPTTSGNKANSLSVDKQLLL